jgi:hypothetical protein
MPLAGVLRNEMEELLSMARSLSMPLLTTSGFLEDVFRHGLWALDLVRKYGEQSIHVLNAARGDGYKRNAFLDGFVRYSVDTKQLTFDNYLRECVDGADFSRDAIAATLTKQFDVTPFNFQALADLRQEAFVDRDETEVYIRDLALEHLIDKTEGRIRAEAEAYAIVANWEVQFDTVDQEGAKDVAVLSQGGFLNRVAFQGPHALRRYIVIPPDALYGFLLNSGGTREPSLAFRELVVSPMFDTTSHFVDKAKYQQFFSHLINDAERIYHEQLPRFREQIDSTLRPEFMDDIDPLERPSVLFSLQAQLEERLTESLDRERLVSEQLKADLGEAQKIAKKQAKELSNLEGALARKKRKQQARVSRAKKKR